MTFNAPLNTYIAPTDEIYTQIHEVVAKNQPLVQALNQATSQEQIHTLLAQITGNPVPESLHVNLPLFTDFGANIHFGEEVFINTNVIFTDLGGIYLGNKVLIEPRVNLITVNHHPEPSKRRGLILAPIHIHDNAWIGAGATILPGVTVGENAIVAAGALVTRDVPANCIVAGVPAKVIKSLTPEQETSDLA
ncbi:sugar O-acetyltransferase [Psittacicella hinzii]|uniref:Acetyltransferase n=1 Tax=Psittacicella hinzii TaxID=2028575 RepID=A0A3A1YNR6_9GAMM|nr:sugar O-acetyltransferase [Psittacicella hinzii]RIY39126.1 acetyltransferase [Psittacicella hinzii]